MNNTDLIEILLHELLMQSPTLIVCIVAIFLIITKWKQSSRGASLALWGFGLVLVLSMFMPILTTLLQKWVFQGGQQTQRMWAFTTFAIVWAVLHAVAYVLILMALFAEQSTSDFSHTTHLDRQ